MSIENKVPMSDFTEVTDIADTARIIGLQDNENVKIPLQSLIAKTLSRVDEDILTVQDINVENGVTGFNPIGEVKQGDKRAVSGDEIHKTYSIGGGLNLLPNTISPTYLLLDAGVELVEEDSETATFENKGDSYAAAYLFVPISETGVNYSLNLQVIDFIGGTYRVQIGSSVNRFNIARTQEISSTGRKCISGYVDVDYKSITPNILLSQGAKIKISKMFLEKGGICNDFKLNPVTYSDIKKVNKFEYGWIDASGNNTELYYQRTMKTTNFIETKNINKLGVDFKNISNRFDLKLLAVIYDKDFKFLRRVSNVSSFLDINIDVCYIRFLIDNSTPAGEWDINQSDFNLSVYFENNNSVSSINLVKQPFVNGLKNVYYDFKRNINLDILDIDVDRLVKYEKQRVIGNGFVLLPPNYNHNGNKTRLIIFGHGSGNTSPDLGHYAPHVDYLVKSGYAVADCHAWGKLNGEYIGKQFFGSKTNYIAYQSFYKYLIEHYNFYEDIFLFGKSQGGLQAYGLPYNTSIPILASCSLAGESSCIGNQFGYDDKDKFAYFEDMGFTGLEKNSEGVYIGEASVMYKKSLYDYEWTPERVTYVRKNLEKFMYYNPIMSGVINLPNVVDTMFPTNTSDQLNTIKNISVPFICFVAKDDMYNNNNRIRAQIQNSGGVYVMRLMPSGTNDPHGQTDKSGPKVDITTDLGYNLKDIAVAFVEMLEFFKQYE